MSHPLKSFILARFRASFGARQKKEENGGIPVLLCHMPERLSPKGRVYDFPLPAVLQGICPFGGLPVLLRADAATFQSAVPVRSFCLRVSATRATGALLAPSATVHAGTHHPPRFSLALFLQPTFGTVPWGHE